MNIRISRLKIKNFRGIPNADISFSSTNFLVGNNGTGKTSCLAAIARLMPILRNEERIFLDGDFFFEDGELAKPIELIYYFNLILDDQTEEGVELRVQGTRTENGEMRSHLNDQQVGSCSISYSNESVIIPLLNSFCQKGRLTQRIFRNGWLGARICPISLQAVQKGNHAATIMKEELGAFDSLRARLVEKLSNTDIGFLVDKEHPDLLSNVLDFTNTFLDESRFADIKIGYSKMLNLVRHDGSKHSWDGLSGGEQSAFNLAMAIEFSKLDQSLLLIIEEPETNLHPSVQRKLLKLIEEKLPDRQIFISTHSPFIFQNNLNSSNIIIGKKTANATTLENLAQQQWLSSNVSWGELSFHAYNLPTFEYHNELYGCIQERTGNWYEDEMESFFTSQDCIQDKQWKRQLSRGNLRTNDRTIMTFIRNFTHHPENTHNNMYTEEELYGAISTMYSIVNTI